MKTFNKSILAAAIAAASFGVSAADATLGSAGGTAVSVEGVTQLGLNEIEHAGIDVTFDNTIEDLKNATSIVIKISGAEFTLGSANDATIVVGDSGVNATAELKSVTEMVVEFDAGGEGDIAGATATPKGFFWDTDAAATTPAPKINNSDFDVTGLPINVESIEDGSEIKVTVTAIGSIGSTDIEIDSASGVIAEGVKQFAFGLNEDSLSAELDAASRTQFVSGAEDGSDGLELKAATRLAYEAADYSSVDITSDGVSYVVEGDFSFLDSDGDGEIDAGVGLSFNNATLSAVEEDFSALTFVSAGAVNTTTNLDNVVTFTTDGEREIPTGSFDVSAQFDYENTGAIEDGSYDSGAKTLGTWSLEGTSGTYAYMPFYDHIDPLFFVTNKANNDADVTVKAWDKAGNVYGPVTLSTQAKAGAVTKLSAAIESALADEGFAGNGSLNVEVTVNSSNVEFYGAYNANGSDRGFVPVK